MLAPLNPVSSDAVFCIRVNILRPGSLRPNVKKDCLLTYIQHARARAHTHKDKQHLIRPFLLKPKNINVEGGGKLNIRILFYLDNLWTAEISYRQIKLGAVKDNALIYKFYLNNFFWRSFLNMAMVWNFNIMFLQTLNHSVQNYTILCNVISL
jgi:hypothetical protein